MNLHFLSITQCLNFTQDLENELRSTQSQQSAILQKLEEKAEAEARQHSGALERLEQSNLAALEEMEQSHDEQLKLLNGIVKEKEIKLLDLATVHQSQMNVSLYTIIWFLDDNLF